MSGKNSQKLTSEDLTKEQKLGLLHLLTARARQLIKLASEGKLQLNQSRIIENAVFLARQSGGYIAIKVGDKKTQFGIVKEPTLDSKKYGPIGFENVASAIRTMEDWIAEVEELE